MKTWTPIRNCLQGRTTSQGSYVQREPFLPRWAVSPGTRAVADLSRPRLEVDYHLHSALNWCPPSSSGKRQPLSPRKQQPDTLDSEWILRHRVLWTQGALISPKYVIAENGNEVEFSSCIKKAILLCIWIREIRFMPVTNSCGWPFCVLRDSQRVNLYGALVFNEHGIGTSKMKCHISFKPGNLFRKMVYMLTKKLNKCDSSVITFQRYFGKSTFGSKFTFN